MNLGTGFNQRIFSYEKKAAQQFFSRSMYKDSENAINKEIKDSVNEGIFYVSLGMGELNQDSRSITNLGLQKINTYRYLAKSQGYWISQAKLCPFADKVAIHILKPENLLEVLTQNISKTEKSKSDTLELKIDSFTPSSCINEKQRITGIFPVIQEFAVNLGYNLENLERIESGHFYVKYSSENQDDSE